MASGVEAVGRVDEQTTLAQGEDGDRLGSLEAGAAELGVASGVLDADRLATLEGAAAQAQASEAPASIVASRASFMSLVQRELTVLVTAGYSPTGVAEALPEGSLRVDAVPREARRPVFECLVMERHQRACAPDIQHSDGRPTLSASEAELERETGFEPATSTLARSRSTK
jgi:hypothetical protein